MAPQIAEIRDIVHGKTIELERDPGLADGQSVTVTVTLPETRQHVPGEGLRRAFGAWAEDAEELDAYLECNRQHRKVGRPEIED